MRPLVLAVALVPFALLACATTPARHIPASGDPLAVDVRDQSYTYTTKEKVGEVEHKDETGRTVGTSTVTQDVSRVGSYTVWSFRQGEVPLDEQDFFAIAGDEEARKQIQDGRSFGEVLQTGGIGAIGVGAAIGVGGLAGSLLLQNGAQPPGISPFYYVSAVGFLTAGVGGYAYYWGLGDLSAEKRWHTAERAQQAAGLYNQRLGASAGLTTDKPDAVAHSR